MLFPRLDSFRSKPMAKKVCLLDYPFTLERVDLAAVVFKPLKHSIQYF